MKNKGITILIAVIVAICLGVAAVVLILALKDKSETPLQNKEEVSLTDQILDIKSVKEFEELTKNITNNYGIADDKSGASIYSFDLFQEKANITYYFDSEQNVEKYEIYFFLNEVDAEAIKELSAEDMEAEVVKVLTFFCQMFNVDSVPDLYLSNSDGTFTKVESTDDYQALLDETSTLSFSLRDENGAYWTLLIYCEEGLCTVDISRFFDVEQYKDYFANISLYDEQGE